MVRIDLSDVEPQDLSEPDCIRVDPAVLTKCWYCKRSVVGVQLGAPGRYAMFCPTCLYLANYAIFDHTVAE